MPLQVLSPRRNPPSGTWKAFAEAISYLQTNGIPTRLDAESVGCSQTTWRQVRGLLQALGFVEGLIPSSSLRKFLAGEVGVLTEAIEAMLPGAEEAFNQGLIGELIEARFPNATPSARARFKGFVKGAFKNLGISSEGAFEAESGRGTRHKRDLDDQLENVLLEGLRRSMTRQDWAGALEIMKLMAFARQNIVGVPDQLQN